MDPINALLSFLYTLLVHDVSSALEGVGLDPAVGFLHRDRPGRPSLALDLMEEFRPMLADRVALTLVNRQQVQGNVLHPNCFNMLLKIGCNPFVWLSFGGEHRQNRKFANTNNFIHRAVVNANPF